MNAGDQIINYENQDIYMGELDEEGQPDGTGTYTHHDEEEQRQQGQYIGEWKNGKKHGRGTHRYRNGDVYDGLWKDGKRDGHGKYTFSTSPSAEYKGDWQNDEMHGKGVMKFTNGDIYDGDWRCNKMESENATYTHVGHSVYIGRCCIHFESSTFM